MNMAGFFEAVRLHRHHTLSVLLIQRQWQQPGVHLPHPRLIWRGHIQLHLQGDGTSLSYWLEHFLHCTVVQRWDVAKGSKMWPSGENLRLLAPGWVCSLEDLQRRAAVGSFAEGKTEVIQWKKKNILSPETMMIWKKKKSANLFASASQTGPCSRCSCSWRRRRQPAETSFLFQTAPAGRS